MKIIQDTREKYPWTFPREVIVSKLDYGDYSLEGYEDQIVIERKATTGELFKNIVEKRFWKELKKISDFPHKYIICEFPEKSILEYPVGSGIPRRYWRKLRVKPPFVLSQIDKIITKLNIPILFSRDREEAEKLGLQLLENYELLNKL